MKLQALYTSPCCKPDSSSIPYAANQKGILSVPCGFHIFPTPSFANASSQSPLHFFHSRSPTPHDIPYPLDLVKLQLQLIDLLHYLPKASHFGVRRLRRIGCGVVLCVGRDLGCLVELVIISVLCLRV